MYGRLQHLAGLAEISLYRLADEIGVTQNGIYDLKKRRGSSWTTLNAISTVLAPRLGRKPSEVYAYLTDLEPVDLSKSPSRSARGRRSAPAR